MGLPTTTYPLTGAGQTVFFIAPTAKLLFTETMLRMERTLGQTQYSAEAACKVAEFLKVIFYMSLGGIQQ